MKDTQTISTFRDGRGKIQEVRQPQNPEARHDDATDGRGWLPHNSFITSLHTPHTIKMKLAIAALLVASAAAFAPSAPVVTRTTSLGYSVKVVNEDEGIDATFDCADDVFIVGE